MAFTYFFRDAQTLELLIELFCRQIACGGSTLGFGRMSIGNVNRVDDVDLTDVSQRVSRERVFVRHPDGEWAGTTNG